MDNKVSLEDLRTNLNAGLGLLVAILAILVFTSLFKIIVFFLQRKKEAAKAVKDKQLCVQHMEAVLQAQQERRERSNSRSSRKSRSRKSNGRSQKQKRDGHSEKSLSKENSIDVNLERGDGKMTSMEQVLSGIKGFEKRNSQPSLSFSTANETSRSAVMKTALGSSLDTPRPTPLLSGQALIGEEAPPIAAAVDSLIMGSTFSRLVPLDMSTVHEAPAAAQTKPPVSAIPLSLPAAPLSVPAGLPPPAALPPLQAAPAVPMALSPLPAAPSVSVATTLDSKKRVTSV